MGFFGRLGDLCTKISIAAKSPEVLSGIAVGGVILTSIFTARAVPKAIRAIEDEKRYRNEMAANRADLEKRYLNKDPKEVYKREYEDLTKVDIFKITFKYFIPPVLCGGITIASIIGAQRINTMRQAAMAAGYEILRNSFDDYRMHVKEVMDKKKFEELEEKIREDKINRILEENPISDKDFEHFDVEAGAVIAVEPTTGHRFVTTYEQLYRMVDDVNDMINPIDGGHNFVSIGTALQMAGDKNNNFPKIAEKYGFMAGGYASKRIDKSDFLKLDTEWHKGHMCTIAYMKTDYTLGELDDLGFTR